MFRAGTCLLVLSLLVARSEPAGAREPIEFARDIQPILAEHCSACHGADDQNGGLRFDVRATAFSAADSGELAIVAGKPESSELVHRVNSTDDELQMPPDGERLARHEIERLEEWIAAGADWPEADGDNVEDPVASSHWSFRPITYPAPPAVDDPAWPLTPLDRFIQAKREDAGLAVAGDADPITLVRRVTFALTGLPPTVDEVEAFGGEAKTQGLDQAMSRLVDRLLARPSYGERWGRHWMDWVRYADTAGDNSDYPIPQAYLYRQYIIESFNQDLPYDRFLTEQLAGDLLPAETQPQRNRQVIATGYLAMARRFGSLIERYPWHLTIEDTIDNVGRTMMGLTISCARCHDHKFDPISARDYYGLYGFFASTQYPQPGLELFPAQQGFAALVSESEAADARRSTQAETDRLTAELQRLLDECEQRAIENAAAEAAATIDDQRRMRDELDAMLLRARTSGERLAKHLKEVPSVPTAYAVRDGAPHDARVQIKGEPFRPGVEVARRFPEVLGGQMLPAEISEQGSGRLQLAGWIASPENPLTARVIVNRVWQRHFGEGLVPTTSDFGLRGEPATHPELLDWLASEFIRGGWSIKHLHRLIMTSRTYRLASQDVDENVARDPGNHYYWKFNRQRLDAESIRDTMMMITGTLDRSPQCEPYPIPPQTEWEYTQHHPYKDDYGSNKRSVYLMTKRLTVPSYFQTFDGPDPNVCTSDRDQSVTPLQALYFVNDESVHEHANHFAESLLDLSCGDQQRARRAFMAILGREPSSDETGMIVQHVATARKQLGGEQQAEQQAWSSLVRSLFRLNEFLYID